MLVTKATNMAWRIVPGINQVDGRTIRICGLCERDGKQSTAEKYCMNCEVYLCIKCKNPHVRFSHGAHEIMDAKDVKEPPGVNDMKGYDKCQIHGDSFRVYCVKHEELCCSDCHIETHKLCEQVPKIELLALVEDALSADIEAEIERINLRAKQAIKSLKRIKEDARHKRVSVEHLVDRIKLTIMQRCDELKSQVSKNLRDVEEKLQRSADDQIPTFEIISCKMESLGNFVSNVRTNGTEVQTFIAGKQIRKEIRETEQNINGHANIENVNTSIELCSSLSDLVVGCESLINFVEGTELIDCTTNQAIKAALLIPVASKILNKEEDDSEEPLYSGLDYFSDGRLAVVDNVNNSVHVLDETLQKRSTYKFENEVRMAMTSASWQTKR